MRRKSAILSMLSLAAADAVMGNRSLSIGDPTGFGSLFGLGLYGEGEGDKGGGGGGAGGGGGGDNGGDDGDAGNKPAPAMVPKDQADRAFRARDAAKKQFRAMVTMAGYDPALTRIEETGDDAAPYRVTVDGEDVTEEFTTRLAGKPKKGGKPADENAIREIEQRFSQRMQREAQRRDEIETGLISVIDEIAAIGPLRSAFHTAGAIDSGGEPGEYTDVIELARKFIRTEVERDDEGRIVLDDRKRPKVTVTPLAPDGSPMMKNGVPVTLADFAKSFLEKRPAWKKNGRPGGAGAGNSNAPAGRATSSGDVKSAAQAAGFAIFGMPAPGAR